MTECPPIFSGIFIAGSAQSACNLPVRLHSAPVRQVDNYFGDSLASNMEAHLTQPADNVATVNRQGMYRRVRDAGTVERFTRSDTP